MMSPPKRYSFPPGKITTRQAAEFIAEVVYPSDDFRDARKRVRQRIRDARQRGDMPDEDPIDAARFFGWAIDQAKWQALSEVEGLPRKPNSGRSEVEFAPMQCEAYGVAIPNDPQELRDEFRRVQVELMKGRAEIAQLKARIREQEAELEEYRAKRRLRSQSAVAAWKKIGRGTGR